MWEPCIETDIRSEPVTGIAAVVGRAADAPEDMLEVAGMPIAAGMPIVVGMPIVAGMPIFVGTGGHVLILQH